MKLKDIPDSVWILLITAGICLYCVLCIIVTEPEEKIVYDGFNSKDCYTPVPYNRWWLVPTPTPTMEDLGVQWVCVDVVYEYIETEYIGEYFITAYCPEECEWSWSTSSGATCHYSDDPMEPTTCAIDRNYHGYGELLMIDGKLYITEDTGPGVRGRWIDCFVETMDEVRYFDTRWTSVYAAWYEYRTYHVWYLVPMDTINNKGD